MVLTRKFMTVKDVADLVRVSEATVRQWIRLRELRAIDLGREWRVIPRDLEAFLATHETCRSLARPGAPVQTPGIAGSAGADQAEAEEFRVPGNGSDNKETRDAGA